VPPQARRAPVVVDLSFTTGVPAGDDGTPAQDTPELDDPPVQDPVGLDEATLSNGRCVRDARAFFDDYQNVIFAGLLLLVLPMLAGMFLGAPLVAREVEHGSHRLVWTQGVSRRSARAGRCLRQRRWVAGR
jgi:hypothetical protein